MDTNPTEPERNKPFLSTPRSQTGESGPSAFNVKIDSTPGRSVAYSARMIPWLVSTDFLGLAFLALLPMGMLVIAQKDSPFRSDRDAAFWLLSVVVTLGYFPSALYVVVRKRLGWVWGILVLFPVTSSLAYLATLLLPPRQR